MRNHDALTRSVTVRIVDNHEGILHAFEGWAASHPELVLLGAHADVIELDLNRDERPDVLVLDLYLGRDDRPSTGCIPRLVDWGTQVLLHTSTEVAVPLREAVSAGAAGLSLKNDGMAALHEAILAVAEGEFACSSELAQVLLSDPRLVAALSPREVEVIQGLDDGLTQQQIAGRLGVAASTVKEHLKSVRTKYMDLGRDITNSHSIVREARRDGWV